VFVKEPLHDVLILYASYDDISLMMALAGAASGSARNVMEIRPRFIVRRPVPFVYQYKILNPLHFALVRVLRSRARSSMNVAPLDVTSGSIRGTSKLKAQNATVMY